MYLLCYKILLVSGFRFSLSHIDNKFIGIKELLEHIVAS